ncbi:MAG: hypothetical protein ACI9R3_001943 [Verrucomicrobiales bacterium]|jgi:hypothetical protein
MKRLLLCVAGFVLVACGDQNGGDAESTSSVEWLVRGELEPKGQFVLTAGEVTAHGEGAISGPGAGM